MDAKYDVDTAVFMHCLLPYLSAYLPTATSFPRHKGSLEKNPDCDVWFLKPVYQDHGSSMAIETGTGKTLQLAILRLHMRLETHMSPHHLPVSSQEPSENLPLIQIRRIRLVAATLSTDFSMKSISRKGTEPQRESNPKACKQHLGCAGDGASAEESEPNLEVDDMTLAGASIHP